MIHIKHNEPNDKYSTNASLTSSSTQKKGQPLSDKTQETWNDLKTKFHNWSPPKKKQNEWKDDPLHWHMQHQPTIV